MNKLFVAAVCVQISMGLAFIALKLAHVLSWSWWQVTAPFWAPWGICGTMVGIIALIERVIDPHEEPEKPEL